MASEASFHHYQRRLQELGAGNEQHSDAKYLAYERATTVLKEYADTLDPDEFEDEEQYEDVRAALLDIVGRLSHWQQRVAGTRYG